MAAVGSQIALNAQEFLGHNESTFADGTEAIRIDLVPNILADAVSKHLGKADISLLLVLALGSIHLSGVNALVEGHQHALSGIPSIVVHITEDVNVGLGLGNYGVNGPGAVNGELVVDTVNSNGPGTLGQCDGLVAAVSSQGARNAQEFLGHNESTFADGTEAEGGNVVPGSCTGGIGKLLGEADVSLLLILAHGGVYRCGIDAIGKGHQYALGGIPSIVVHVTEDVDILNDGTNLYGDSIKRYNLILKVKLEGQVVGASLTEVVVLVAVRASGVAPAVCPCMVGSHLVIQGVVTRNLNIVLHQLVQTVGLVEGHVVVGVGNIPRASEDVGVIAGYSEAGENERLLITCHLCFHCCRVETEGVLLTDYTREQEGFAGVAFYRSEFNTRANGHVASRRTRVIAVAVVHIIPFAKNVGKNEPNVLFHEGHVNGIGAVVLQRHLHTLSRIPTSEGIGAHHIHCRVGFQTNEGKQ